MPSVYIPVRIQRTVIERAGGRCEYCQSLASYATETFAIEHTIPVSLGGSNQPENLAYACSGCNGRKYNRLEASDPADGQFVPLFNPRQQEWQTHFAWSDDYCYIFGLTPTDRATVNALELNRQGVVNMREVLYPIGKHPPIQFDYTGQR